MKNLPTFWLGGLEISGYSGLLSKLSLANTFSQPADDNNGKYKIKGECSHPGSKAKILLSGVLHFSRRQNLGFCPLILAHCCERARGERLLYSTSLQKFQEAVMWQNDPYLGIWYEKPVPRRSRKRLRLLLVVAAGLTCAGGVIALILH